MGPLSFRTYHQVNGDDRSQMLQQVEALRARVSERLKSVRSVVAVMSGKGGVGKSHVAAALALGATRQSIGGVGVLDGDLRSPTVARTLDARGPLRVTDAGVEPARGREGIRVVSTDLLLRDGQPLTWREPGAERFVWRGALETNALREFLSDVLWGDLELLIVDLPPGADGVTDVHALVPALSGAVIVTIPSEESRRSVERTMRSALDEGIPLLGIIENMSGYRCPGCDDVRPLFAGAAGRELAEEFDLPLWGTVPFSPAPALTAVPSLPDSIVSQFLESLP